MLIWRQPQEPIALQPLLLLQERAKLELLLGHFLLNVLELLDAILPGQPEPSHEHDAYDQNSADRNQNEFPVSLSGSRAGHRSPPRASLMLSPGPFLAGLSLEYRDGTNNCV